MHWIAGIRCREIAGMLGKRPAAVRSALKRLKVLLLERHPASAPAAGPARRDR